MELPISNIGQYLTAFSITSMGQFFPSIWTILLIIAVVIGLIIFLIGAIQWITSGDDKEKKTGARNKIMAALIGLLIVLLAWVISGFLMGAFGFPTVFQIPGGNDGGTSAGRCTDENGNSGQTCDNLNKCDIAGGCNPACCTSTADCPPGQHCSIPNGYCQSGKSCSTQTATHKDCVGNQCVYVPGEGSDKCTWNSDCPL